MSQTIIWTYQDAVDFILDSEGLESTALMNVRNAKRAVMEAMRRLYNITSVWSIYKARYNFTANAPYTTGTITYDATTRVVTLTGGTFPSWAARGRLRIATLPYTIETRNSDTSITLKLDSCPASDITTATTFELFQETYPLPVNFKRSEFLLDTQLHRRIPIQNAINAAYDSITTSGDPIYAFVRGDQEFLGSIGITLVPPPSTSRLYEIGYERSPRELRIANISVPACSVPVGTTTVTATTSVFPVGCEGSIIRFSTSATAPTSMVDANPFYAQRVITSRTSATVVTIDQPVDIELTAVAATVSDPLDMEYGSMMGAFQALCVAQFAKIGNRKDVAEKEALAMSACRAAMEADHRSPVNGNVPMASFLVYRTEAPITP